MAGLLSTEVQPMGDTLPFRRSQKGLAQLKDLLAEVPNEGLHPFYTAVHEDLQVIHEKWGQELAVTPEGICRGGAGLSGRPLCSPFRVRAKIHGVDKSKKKKDWASIIEILNPAGEVVDCELPLGISVAKIMERLGADGFQLFTSRFGPDLYDLISVWPAPSLQAKLEEVGWAPDLDAFALPSGRILAREAAARKYCYTGPRNGVEKGDLLAWQSGVGALARKNLYMLFSCSVAFATPLLPYVTETGSVIFHLHGDTTKGKTGTARAALTIWPWIGAGEMTWEGTDNGLEGETASSNNLLIVLDELTSKLNIDVGQVIYRIAGGTGKGRATKEGKSQDRATWRTFVLSTGEESSVKVLEEMGQEYKGGQGVRMLDIPVYAKFGAFDDLHGEVEPLHFVTRLAEHVTENAGAAGAAFVSKLLQQENIKERLKVATKAETSVLRQHLGLEAGGPKSREAGRVLNRFALVGVAGEWATEFGITGWEPGEAAEAVREIALRWYEQFKTIAPSTQKTTAPSNRKATTLDERDAAIAKVREALRHAGEAYMDLEAAKKSQTMPEGTSGFQDANCFYILKAALAGFHPEAALAGFQPEGKAEEMARFLRDASYLMPNKSPGALQYRMPEVCGRKRQNVYRIKRTILNA